MPALDPPVPPLPPVPDVSASPVSGLDSKAEPHPVRTKDPTNASREAFVFITWSGLIEETSENARTLAALS
jgi:hypothetical protein